MILTVPHAGTRFMRTLLSRHEAGRTYVHTFWTDEAIEGQINGTPIISPLRDPYEVYCTWMARYGSTRPETDRPMELCWERLAELDERYDVFYLPLDVPSRSQRLKDLEALLDQPLSTTWEKVASFRPGKPRETPPEKDLQWIYDLPMVKQFYGS
jgi:hypothetical protein